jgi:hypothetical protein
MADAEQFCALSGVQEKEASPNPDRRKMFIDWKDQGIPINQSSS